MSHTFKAVDRVEWLASAPLHHKAQFQGFFGLLGGQNALKMGSKWAHFTRWCTPNGLG